MQKGVQGKSAQGERYELPVRYGAVCNRTCLLVFLYGVFVRDKL
jgi:hypothetical protein